MPLAPNAAWAAAELGGGLQGSKAAHGCGVFVCKIPLAVLSLDVAAFDNLDPAHAASQLSDRNATPAQVAAAIREATGTRVQPRIGAVEGPWQEIEKGFRQGAARCPEVWNHTIASHLERARQQCEQHLGPTIRGSAEL